MANITIKEIAQRAGVSIGTVDRVIHNRGHVDPDKAERIRMICAQAGYQPNTLARALIMRGKNMRIAAAINSPDYNLFSRRVKEGLDAICQERKDYNITPDYFFMRESSAQQQLAHLEQIRREGYSGLVIKPIQDPEVERTLGEMIRDGMPVVTCTSDMPGLDTVGFVGQDHAKEGRLAANMLCTCFRRPIRAAVMSQKKNVWSRTQKISAFCRYMEQAGNQITDVVEVSDEPGLMYRQTQELLRRRQDLDALYAHAGDVGPICRAVEDLGLGKRLCLFTFGEKEDTARLLQKGQILFAIEEKPYQHGYYAGRMMIDYLLSRTRPAEPRLLIEANVLIAEAL